MQSYGRLMRSVRVRTLDVIYLLAARRHVYETDEKNVLLLVTEHRFGEGRYAG